MSGTKSRTGSGSGSGPKAVRNGAGHGRAAPAAATAGPDGNTRGLEAVYLDLLRDTYNAESQMINALSKMARAASAPELVKGLLGHLDETEVHIERLRVIFADLGERPGDRLCEAMRGLIEEGEEGVENNPKGAVRDAALIVSAQKAEHYEIAAYGSLSAFARLLGKDRHVDLLEQTLSEEREADEALTRVASEIVNPGAAAMSEDSGVAE